MVRVLEGSTLEKNDFAEGVRYAVTLRDEGGKLRPANFYVYKCFDDFMIARMTDKAGLLHKLKYEDVIKIVKTIPVSSPKKFMLPDAVLNPKAWASRTTMQVYGSAPGLGK